jgi:transcriptional regulator CtsR
LKAAIGAKVAERTQLKIIRADLDQMKKFEALPDRVEACFDDKNLRCSAREGSVVRERILRARIQNNL